MYGTRVVVARSGGELAELSKSDTALTALPPMCASNARSTKLDASFSIELSDTHDGAAAGLAQPELLLEINAVAVIP